MSRTRSGIQSDKPRYQTFTVRTQQIREYMQKKVDIITSCMNKNGDPIPQMQIDLYSHYMSKKFVPLVLILEPTAAEYYYQNNNDDVEQDGEEIFNVNEFDSKDNEKVAELKKPFVEFFDNFKYTKEDLNDLRSSNYKREMRINNINTKAIRHFSVPRFYTMTGGDGIPTTRIVMIVDPIKVLFDMIVENNDKNFEIEIWIEKKVNDSEYEYKIRKIPQRRRNRNGNKAFRDNLNRRMSTL